MYDKVIKSDEEKFEEEIEGIKDRQQRKLIKIKYFNDLKKKEYSPRFSTSFKDRIKSRDNYTCQLCGKKTGLTVHHITYNKKNTSDDVCVTLCRGCNSRVNEKKKRKYWEEHFRNLIYYKQNR